MGNMKMYVDEFNKGHYNNLRYYHVTAITEKVTRPIIQQALNNAVLN